MGGGLGGMREFHLQIEPIEVVNYGKVDSRPVAVAGTAMGVLSYMTERNLFS